jgi:hypothetical protein
MSALRVKTGVIISRARSCTDPARLAYSDANAVNRARNRFSALAALQGVR